MAKDASVPWVETPLIPSDGLSAAANCRIYLKLDNLQPSGSFKSRGIGNYVLRRLEEWQWGNKTGAKPPHFYVSSGGNAGIACVHAASKCLGYETTVVVPTKAKPHMLSKLKAMGASRIIKHGDSVLDADKYLKEVIINEDPNGIYVPPFDHADIWEGNGTMMREIISQLGGERPDVIVCSVGGGGLMNGLVQVLDEYGWSDDVDVLAMETDGADSLAASLNAGQLITLPKITSQATSLGVARVSQRTWEYAQRPRVHSAVVSDAVAANGCCLFAQHERMLVELTVGVNVAVCFDGLLESCLGRKVGAEEKVVIVVCGGSDTNLEMVFGWKNAEVEAARMAEKVVSPQTAVVVG